MNTDLAAFGGTAGRLTGKAQWQELPLLPNIF